MQRFIHEDWKNNHILSVDGQLLDWQHKDIESDSYLYYVAVNNRTANIDALIGEIPLWHFDEKLKKFDDVWLAIWMNVQNRAEEGGLGLVVLDKIRQRNPQSIGAIGINDNVAKIYRHLGFKLGVMKQYMIPNISLENKTISSVKTYNNTSIQRKSAVSEIVFDMMASLPMQLFPAKSMEYLKNRYKMHPRYHYRYFGVYREMQLTCAFIARKIVIDKSSCMRVVDVAGDLAEAGNVFSSMQQILKNENSEYIDLLNYGIEEEVFHNLGFASRGSEDIIPNYFEPFVYQNVDVKFAYLSKKEPYIIFKGDSDQDRPNFITRDKSKL